MEKASERARTRARDSERGFIINSPALVRARAPAVRTPRDCARYCAVDTMSRFRLQRLHLSCLAHARLPRGAVWPNYRGLALSA